MEAAARVFAEVGLERSTTNEIAQRAGCSVGSLYQYYPSKHALLTALFERESARLHGKFLSLVAELGFDDLPRLVRAFVAETLQVFEDQKDLYRVLLEEVPRFAGLEPTHAVDRVGIAAMRTLLEVGRSRSTIKNREMGARLLVRAYRYTTMATLREPMNPAEREAFTNELTALLVNYLVAPRPWEEED